MPVTDLAREAARRYMATMPIVDWAREVLGLLGVPPAALTPAREDELVVVWRRALEVALVEHYTIPGLGALARFYSTPEGAAIWRKLMAFQTAIAPALMVEIVACARAIVDRIRAQSSAGEPTS